MVQFLPQARRAAEADSQILVTELEEVKTWAIW